MDKPFGRRRIAFTRPFAYMFNLEVREDADLTYVYSAGHLVWVAGPQATSEELTAAVYALAATGRLNRWQKSLA